MKNIIIILSIAVVVVAVSLFFFLKFFSTPTSGVPNQTDTNNGYQQTDNSGTSGVNTTPTQNTSSNTFSVRSTSGTVIKVKDFEKAPTTQPDKNNGGHYYLAGVFSPTNPNPPYTITYTESDQSFTIALWQKPLKQTRANAEQFLLQALGITMVQACSLTYYISVPVDVDTQYGSANLGFSFCPGAKAL